MRQWLQRDRVDRLQVERAASSQRHHVRLGADGLVVDHNRVGRNQTDVAGRRTDVRPHRQSGRHCGDLAGFQQDITDLSGRAGCAGCIDAAAFDADAAVGGQYAQIGIRTGQRDAGQTQRSRFVDIDVARSRIVQAKCRQTRLQRAGVADTQGCRKHGTGGIAIKIEASPGQTVDDCARCRGDTDRTVRDHCAERNQPVRRDRHGAGAAHRSHRADHGTAGHRNRRAGIELNQAARRRDVLIDQQVRIGRGQSDTTDPGVGNASIAQIDGAVRNQADRTGGVGNGLVDKDP